MIWLSDFFIPHLSTPKSSLFLILTRAPRYLLHIGLASFVVHIAYLYWIKFVKKRVATRLLYRYVRHPQYLSFAVAGVGLVFHWPRFINVILFFLMLFAYYALARSEEARMERRHGEAYRTYKQKTAMFFPGRAGERVMGVTFGWLPQTPLRGYVALLSVCGSQPNIAYLYWIKFVKKRVATRLLYRYVRHPQYLSFAVAGVGLVFHWPRFINVILFFLMLFAYYALARSGQTASGRRE